jgi:hypothetical protein
MSAPSKKKTSEETVQTILQQAESDVIAREVQAMTDEEVARELRDAGIDIEEERARWRARKKKLDAEERAKKKRPRGLRFTLLLAATIGMCVAALLVVLGQTPDRAVAEPRVRAPKTHGFFAARQECSPDCARNLPAAAPDAGR